MPGERDDLVFVRHILDAISKIQRYTAGMTWEDFSSDEKTQDAVVRQFEVVGEAAKKVSEAFRSQHPNVPWSQMAKMRDVLIHHLDISAGHEGDTRGPRISTVDRIRPLVCLEDTFVVTGREWAGLVQSALRPVPSPRFGISESTAIRPSQDQVI